MRVRVGDVSLNVVQEGKGPLVVLLHGFPESSDSWRHQVPALARAGFRAVAPDMRGYNLSDKPRRVKDYAVTKLAGDVAGLIRALGEERAIVVGHDWGGIVAWQFAMAYPEMLERLAILNMPHPVRMLEGLRTSAKQRKKSGYVFFFQLPVLPEILIARRDFALLRKMFRDDGVPDDAIERYIEAARRSGLHGPMNYYRASIRGVVTRSNPQPRRIEAPVLVLWGERDRHLGAELAEPSREWVPNFRIERHPEASHWIQDAAPEWVSERLVAFAREGHRVHAVG